MSIQSADEFNQLFMSINDAVIWLIRLLTFGFCWIFLFVLLLFPGDRSTLTTSFQSIEMRRRRRRPPIDLPIYTKINS